MTSALLKRLSALAGELESSGTQAQVIGRFRALLASLEEACDRQELQIGQLRNQLAQTARLAELGLMAGSIFHEMNQPLLGIKGFAELIKASIDEGNNSRIAEWVEEIRAQAIRMHEMQKNVRAFLKRDTGDEGQGVDFQDCLDQSLRLLANRIRKNKIEIRRAVPEDVPPLDISRVQLIQILVNLAGNAIEAMEGTTGGTLAIVVAAQPESSRARVLFADWGNGIPPGQREQIFEPFFTTKGQKGTGLGLYITRALAEANGGDLQLVDPQSLGWENPPRTVFELILPRKEVAAEVEVKSQKQLARPQDALSMLNRRLEEHARQLQVSRRVLVVDDEPVILRVVSEYLAQKDILADVVATAEEAFERLGGRDYAVVISDKNLPGMNGIELLKQVKDKWPRTEVLIITGFASVDSALDAIDAGAFDYIPKPFPNLTYVAEKVRGAMARYDFESRIDASINFLANTCKAILTELSDEEQKAHVKRLQEVLATEDEDERGKVVVLGPAALANSAKQMGFHVQKADDLQGVLSILQEDRHHVVVFVEEESGPAAPDLVSTIRKGFPDIGVFVVAKEGNLKEIVQAIGVGVGDYLIRPIEGRELFGPRLNRLVDRQRRISKYRRLLQSLKKMNIELQLSL